MIFRCIVRFSDTVHIIGGSISCFFTVLFRPDSFCLDENNETPVLTGHTTPGVVSSIVSSEALQADLLQAGVGLQRPENVPEDPPEEDREDYQDGEEDHEDRDDNPDNLVDNEPNEMFDSYWPNQNSGNDPITISSHYSSQEDVYEVRYGAEDNPEEDPDDHEGPEVISDSDSEEAHDDYENPIDRFIPIQNDSDDPESHDHPSVEIVEPEGLQIYQEGEYEDVSEDEGENEDEIYADEDEEQRHPSIWQQGSRRISAPPRRRYSSSSDEVICLDSD